MRAAALLVILGACADEAAPDYNDIPINCADVVQDDLSIGLTKTGDNGLLTFKLMELTPAPPDIKLDNTWVIEIDAAGTPVGGATIDASPYQIEHGHTSAKSVVVTPNATAGQYELTKVYFTMPGTWETTFDVSSPAGNDRAVFRICFPT